MTCAPLFFSPAGLTDLEQFLQVISQVAIASTFLQKFQVLSHQCRTTPQQEGDLAGLAAALRELNHASERGEIVRHGLGRVLEATANLTGGLALQRESH